MYQIGQNLNNGVGFDKNSYIRPRKNRLDVFHECIPAGMVKDADKKGLKTETCMHWWFTVVGVLWLKVVAYPASGSLVNINDCPFPIAVFVKFLSKDGLIAVGEIFGDADFYFTSDTISIRAPFEAESQGRIVHIFE